MEQDYRMERNIKRMGRNYGKVWVELKLDGNTYKEKGEKHEDGKKYEEDG